MSNLTPQVARRHRHNQSEDIPSSAEASRNIRNQHSYNNQAHSGNSRPIANYGQPTTPPRTPQKAPNGGPDKNSSSAVGPGSSAKPKSKGNNRVKSMAATPAKAKHAQSAGYPTMSKPISTPNAAAYAGPTFHASPAPSTLPMPSFFSKSVPESPSIKLTHSRADGGNTSSSDSSTPPAVKAEISEQVKESPLDFFFNADREEKARARSANSAVGPFQPPASKVPNGISTPVPNSQNRRNHSNLTGGSGSSMFAMELDGTPGKPFGPAFSTPYSERINAARSSPSLLSSPANTSEQQKNTERSEALKSFLFSGQKPVLSNGYASEPSHQGHISPTPNRVSSQPISPPVPRINYHSSPQQNRNGFPFINNGSGLGSATRNAPRTSGLRQEVTPTKTPIPTPERMDDSAFQSFNSPSRNLKENSVSRRHVLGGNLNSNQTPPFGATVSPSVTTSHIHNSDLRTMEDSLRRILKLEPAVAGDTGITVASASAPRY